MPQYRTVKFAIRSILIAMPLLSAVSWADTTKLEGLIIGRSGSTMIVQTKDTPSLLVLLTDTTKVGQIQGVLQARKKEMSMAALVPGLAVRIEGNYGGPNDFVATSVSFKGNDLQRAQSIQAGLQETKSQALQNKADLEKQRETLQKQKEALQQQQANLARQEEHLGKQQVQLTAQQEKIAANKAAIAAAVARFGQLDDYYIFDEVTVLFGNGKVAVTPEYEAKLRQLAQKTKTVEAYMIQIVGYASSAGSASLNQRLSEDRANNVANFLVQQCNIPLTNLLAPGAMGESRQVGDDTTAEGQTQNRRVVVRILQNKGIAGL